MATFEKQINSVAGYIGKLPSAATNWSSVKTDYIQWSNMGANSWANLIQYNLTNYFASEFTPDWLTNLNIGSGFTPCVAIPLTGTAGVVPYSLVFGVNSSGAIAFWYANSITPNIPLSLRFEVPNESEVERTYMAAYYPLNSLSSVKYDVWYNGTYLYFYGISNASAWDHWAGNYWQYPSVSARCNVAPFLDLLKYEVNVFSNLGINGLYGPEFSPDYGTPSEESGYTGGTFDDSSDTISIPAMPSFGVTSTGFINVYEVSQGALVTFGSELFPDLSFTPISTLPTPTDVVTALENIATVAVDFGNQIPNIIDMYINNTLINYILDCHIIPVSPTTSGTNAIKVGFRTFSPSAGNVTSDYVDFDCGSLNVNEYYANFLDYAPYTSAKLFLPFVGFVDMLPEFWQSGTLNIKYRFNVIDGSFMCFVSATSSKSKLSNTVIAQYGGNACVHLPITGTNYSNMITGLIGAASGVAAGGHAASALMGGAASALNAVATRSGMQSSNSYNSSTSFLGIRTPYLLIERTVADFSASYDTEHGLPSNITAKFSSLSGFTTSSRVHLDGFTGATSAELDEISSLLAGGVIL